MTSQIRYKRFNKLIWLAMASVIIFGVVGSLKSSAQSSGSASMYLSPASASITNGSNVSIQIRVNSGTTGVNAVYADLSYDQSKLQYINIINSSTYTISAPSSGGGGSVTVARAVLPEVFGDQLVATVVFKAIGSGITTVNVDSTSRVMPKLQSQLGETPPLNPTSILNSRVGATYTIASSGTPPPTPTPTPTPPSPTPTPSQSPPKQVTPPATPTPNPASPVGAVDNPIPVETPQATAITDKSVTIIWKTNEPSTSEVQYGLTQAYGFLAGDSALTKDHKVVLSGNLIVPGLLYYYRVGGTTAEGKVLASTGYEFNTTGIDLTVSVIDKKDAAVADAIVSVLGKTATTDKLGKAVINDLPSGKQEGTVVYKGKTTKFSVTIDNYSTGNDKQALTVQIQDSLLDNPLILLIPIIGIGALIIFTILQLIKRNRAKAELARHFPFESKMSNPNNMTNSSYAPGSVINVPTVPPTPTVPPPGSVQEPTPQPNQPPKNGLGQ